LLAYRFQAIGLSAQTPAPSSPPQDAPEKKDSTAKSAHQRARMRKEVSRNDTDDHLQGALNLVSGARGGRDKQGKIVRISKKKARLFR